MARVELLDRLTKQLERVQKAMMTATNGELEMLDSLKRDIESQLTELRASVYTQPKAA